MITITLNREAILYDIGNIAYITGDLMHSDVKDQSGVQDVNNEGNIDKVTRILNKSFNELVYGLTAFTKKDYTEDIVLDDNFSVPGEYVLELSTSLTFSSTNAKAVMTAAHEYMVDMVLFEWFTITKKDEFELYKMKADEELLKMKRYLNSRTKAVRRPLRPF
ncbi:hypothetical protein [uncultured Bacteroides sp.]|uniref:hypothetical protein n=1 Tax=uncultured Bacteroides sp. TaxID=162156 RepID=UPI002AA7FFB4|nr:hypothetical protein [uncultured Bacteroides sp.]